MTWHSAKPGFIQSDCMMQSGSCLTYCCGEAERNSPRLLTVWVYWPPDQLIHCLRDRLTDGLKDELTDKQPIPRRKDYLLDIDATLKTSKRRYNRSALIQRCSGEDRHMWVLWALDIHFCQLPFASRILLFMRFLNTCFMWAAYERLNRPFSLL